MYNKLDSTIKILLRTLVGGGLSTALSISPALAYPLVHPFSFWKTTSSSQQHAQSTFKAQSADLQQRLIMFSTASDTATRYAVAKAKMWLSYASNENSERSQTTAGRLAFEQSSLIVNALEQHQTLDVNALTLPMMASPRPDLWMTVQQLKAHHGFDCAAPEVAQAEVMLFWATAQHCELGWRHSREGFAAAQRLLNRATDAAFNCKADVPPQLPKLEHAIQLTPFDKKSCHNLFLQDAKIAQ